MIRVLIADDHGVMRDGLGRLIGALDDMEVVGLAADGEAAVELCRTSEPHVVVMDLEMPGVDGIQATRRILADRPQTAVLALTAFSDRPRILGALEAGACGYLLKDASADQVADAIRAAARGESPLDPRAASVVLAARSEPDPAGGLSPREREVLGQVVDGRTNKEIARALGLSPRTVETHRTHLAQKLETGSLAQLVRRYAALLDEPAP